MQIRKLDIMNFRGIKSCSWVLPENRFVCLVGPGDSTKTTLLDAIGLALSPRWNVQFTDSDFYNCETDLPIIIQVTVTDLPKPLLRDDTFLFELSGLQPSGEVVHDPVEGSEPCLIVQLKVTDSLEPAWSVVRSGEDSDGKTIKAGLREHFGVFRVDDRVDNHLRWGRGSALSRMTTEKIGVDSAVVAAHRAAREAIFQTPPPTLLAASIDVRAAAHAIGSAEFANLRPGLDPGGVSSSSALMLHEGSIPLTAHGLGTRRLTSLAIQESAVSGGAIVLVDEIEHGLEPHRLQHLLRHLKTRTSQGSGQVIMTTHSPVVVEYLSAVDIAVVRSQDGHSTARQAPPNLDDAQGAFRSGPSALLSRKVVVCEGKTELGMVRSFAAFWDSRRRNADLPPHSALGVWFSDGHGSTTAPQRALTFLTLGYPALLVIDNDDRAADQGVEKFLEAGGNVVRWSSGRALEDEVVEALTTDGLRDFLALAAEIKDEESVRNAVSSRLSASLLSLDPAEWIAGGIQLADVRQAIANAAKAKKTSGSSKEESKAWFKREDGGEALGAFIADRWPDLCSTTLGRGVADLRTFIFGEWS